MRSRFFLALALSSVLAFGAFGLAACGSKSSNNSGSATSATSAQSTSQDNCYGNDLPATK